MINRMNNSVRNPYQSPADQSPADQSQPASIPWGWIAVALGVVLGAIANTWIVPRMSVQNPKPITAQWEAGYEAYIEAAKDDGDLSE